MNSILYQVQTKIGRRWARDTEHVVFRAASARREQLKGLLAIGELPHVSEIRIKPIVSAEVAS